ncbi:MAG TPA: helix-turn-helix domain-containing protein [Bacillota bacterium]|nr:helix-turn-helix domain-containing protein [Bacillota bacterium]
MDAKKEDRRVQRTRNMLMDAFIDLMIQKGYEAITVQDVIDRANVGRSTFYSHFADKEQLLVASINQLGDFLKEQSRNRSLPEGAQKEYQFGFSLAMLQHVQSAKRIFKATMGEKGGSFVLSHMRRMLADLTRDEIQALLPPAATLSIPQEVLIDFILNTLLILLTWWLENDTPCSAAEVDRMFHQLILNGLSSFR